jgi:protein-S-isoprenylcysteine O-methyltransferase Ste14
MTLAGVGFFAWLALIGLDAARFRWSRVPDWAQAFGAALLAGAMALFFLTFRANPFLSPAVRMQSDRGQSVVSAGRTGSCATRCTRRSLLCRLSG